MGKAPRVFQLDRSFLLPFRNGPPTPCRHVDGARLSVAAPQTKKTLATAGFGIVMGAQSDALHFSLAPHPAIVGTAVAGALAAQHN